MLGLPTSLFRRWLVRVTGTFFPVPVTVHSRARFLLLAKFGLKRSKAYKQVSFVMFLFVFSKARASAKAQLVKKNLLKKFEALKS